MNKLASVIIVTVMAVFATLGLTGCARNQISKMDIDPAVTVEEVNDSSAQVVRGTLEALFTGNREQFEKCFPETFIKELNEAGIDFFENYSQGIELPGEFKGTQYLNYNELNAEGGYDDWETFRSNIALVQGVPESDIDSMQIVHIKVYFEIDGENKYQEVYAIAYHYADAWYMYDLQDADAELG